MRFSRAFIGHSRTGFFARALLLLLVLALVILTHGADRVDHVVNPPADEFAVLQPVKRLGPGFVLEVYDIVENLYYDYSAINAPRLLNVALSQVEITAAKEGKKFKADRIPENADPRMARSWFIMEFMQAEDVVTNNDALAFYAASAMLDSLKDSHAVIVSEEFPKTDSASVSAKPVSNLLKVMAHELGFIPLIGGNSKIYYWLVGSVELDPGGAHLATEKIKKISGPESAGIILDLRDCPGGDLRVVAEILSCFLPEHTFLFESRASYEDKLHYARSSFTTDVPIAILINNRSMSAAEMIASVLQLNHRAIIVGEHSPGKVSLCHQFPVFRESITLSVTVEEYLTSEGRPLEKNGVKPDFPVLYKNSLIDDAQIRAAGELLLGRWRKKQ